MIPSRDDGTYSLSVEPPLIQPARRNAADEVVPMVTNVHVPSVVPSLLLLPTARELGSADLKRVVTDAATDRMERRGPDFLKAKATKRSSRGDCVPRTYSSSHPPRDCTGYSSVGVPPRKTEVAMASRKPGNAHGVYKSVSRINSVTAKFLITKESLVQRCYVQFEAPRYGAY